MVSLQWITIHCNKLTLGKYIENLAHIWWFGFLRPPPQNRLLAASSRCNHPSAAAGKCCNHRTVPLIHWCNHRTVPLVHRRNHHTLPSVHWCNHCIVPLIHYSNHRTVRLVHWCNGCCTFFGTLLQTLHCPTHYCDLGSICSTLYYVSSTITLSLYSKLPQSLHCPQRNHHTDRNQIFISNMHYSTHIHQAI